MGLNALDIVSLLIYLGGMAAMGFYFSRKNISTEEYFVGSRSFAGWVVGLSLVGASISSITFIAYPADAFKTAWLRYLPNFGLPLAVIVASHFFLPFFRKRKTTSAYEYLEDRFGPSIRIYAAITFIIAQIARLSIVLFLVSLLVYQMTGFNIVICILIGGVVVSVYTIVGGIDAVIWTDVVQTITLILGGVICLGIIIYKLPGGIGQIFEVAAQHGKFAIAELVNGKIEQVPWNLSLQSKTGTMMILLGFSYYLTEYCGNQNVVQKYCTSKNAREARKAMFTCAFFSLPIWAFYMFLGTSLFVFFQVFPRPEAAEMLNDTQKAEQILPFFIMNYVPMGARGIIIAAALAAAMSTLDSGINSVATVGIVDIYRRHCVKDQDDRHYLKVAWIFATAVSVIMIVGAIIVNESDPMTIQDTATKLTSLLWGGMLGIYFLGFFTRKGDARAVGCGIVCTMLFTIWTILAEKTKILPPWLHVPFNLYYTGTISNLVMFFVGFFIGCLLPNKKKDFTNLTIYDQDNTPLQ